MKSFKQWLQQRESSPTTRSRSAAAFGLYPVTGHLASHTRSTMSPWESKVLGSPKKRKKRRKKKAS